MDLNSKNKEYEVQPDPQYCGAGTGTAGNLTFSLSGTGMHFGYGSGSRSGRGSGSNIKCNKKKKNRKRKANFLGNKLLLTLKRQNFVQFSCFWKTAMVIIVWKRNRNQNFPIRKEPGTETQQNVMVPQHC